MAGAQQTRARRAQVLDQSYGARARNKIDIFRCGKADAPLLAYIHGGYWQRNAKEFYACLAEGPLARGMDAAMIGYTLAPEATLTAIVDEIRAALRWLRAEGPRLGLTVAALIAAGWSAGGHLTAMGLAEADAGLAISGSSNSPQSINSSASERNDAGIVKPSVFAVFRLITSSNFVDCSTGRSAAFAPLRILAA
jgi:acetyl esterase/lipase